ncbi:uncharacterized protein LACBIDRAFT_335022 [Laccaria bicolor S238N-H82]|uniref:Predicted protein n=1 Tax=Laccaria bicolor (strain S238N-H82 / ATCC MYA-4686) TaxID=486041 RepID=B0E142_LACBS|nr:uncharacterized protein LACBIDRAFT_335022 [Laccaria bicolor S238N-H82]EDQ99459.1 predicted protein [Laccaria bicolor S238N-H82]|eukprot:XP_001889914.1 predicted protein [Laccaria bicolor S238N-H82]
MVKNDLDIYPLPISVLTLDHNYMEGKDLMMLGYVAKSHSTKFEMNRGTLQNFKFGRERDPMHVDTNVTQCDLVTFLLASTDNQRQLLHLTTTSPPCVTQPPTTRRRPQSRRSAPTKVDETMTTTSSRTNHNHPDITGTTRQRHVTNSQAHEIDGALVAAIYIM